MLRYTSINQEQNVPMKKKYPSQENHIDRIAISRQEILLHFVSVLSKNHWSIACDKHSSGDAMGALRMYI